MEPEEEGRGNKRKWICLLEVGQVVRSDTHISQHETLLYQKIVPMSGCAVSPLGSNSDEALNILLYI